MSDSRKLIKFRTNWSNFLWEGVSSNGNIASKGHIFSSKVWHAQLHTVLITYVVITRKGSVTVFLNSGNISYLLIPEEIAYNIFLLCQWKAL